jgi:acyl carrier protein
VTRAAFVNTVADIMGVPPGTLTPDATRDTVAGWSSLTDVTILTVIASELGIEAEDELLDYTSVGELLDILERRQAFSG